MASTEAQLAALKLIEDAIVWHRDQFTLELKKSNKDDIVHHGYTVYAHYGMLRMLYDHLGGCVRGREPRRAELPDLLDCDKGVAWQKWLALKAARRWREVTAIRKAARAETAAIKALQVAPDPADVQDAGARGSKRPRVQDPSGVEEAPEAAQPEIEPLL